MPDHTGPAGEHRLLLIILIKGNDILSEQKIYGYFCLGVHDDGYCCFGITLPTVIGIEMSCCVKHITGTGSLYANKLNL